MDRSAPAPPIADLLRAVAEPQRLALLLALAERPRAVSELVEGSGLAQASVSHHLAVLRRAGLVDAVREGRRQVYAWTDAGTAPAADALRQWLLRWATDDRIAEFAASPRSRNPTSANAYPRSRVQSLEDHLL